MITPVDNALFLASLGLPVFPTHEKTTATEKWKAPRTRRGFYDATSDPIMIRAWWQTWPNAMPAIATGLANLVVIDVDCKDGKPGLENWAKICEQLQLDPSNWVIVQTPSGGLHILFKQIEPRLGCSNGKIADGVDVKGDGGYVIAAGGRSHD